MYTPMNEQFMFQLAADRVAEMQRLRSAESTGGLGHRWWHREPRALRRRTRVAGTRWIAHLAR